MTNLQQIIDQAAEAREWCMANDQWHALAHWVDLDVTVTALLDMERAGSPVQEPGRPGPRFLPRVGGHGGG